MPRISMFSFDQSSSISPDFQRSRGVSFGWMSGCGGDSAERNRNYRIVQVGKDL